MMQKIWNERVNGQRHRSQNEFLCMFFYQNELFSFSFFLFAFSFLSFLFAFFIFVSCLSWGRETLVRVNHLEKKTINSSIDFIRQMMCAECESEHVEAIIWIGIPKE